jgi:hypothetical protein
MRKLLLLNLVIAISFSIAAQNKEPYMTKSLSSESVKSTEVQTSGGSITVTGVTQLPKQRLKYTFMAIMAKMKFQKKRS